MARNVHNIKEQDKATFFSLSDVWGLPVPSSTKPGASRHMLSGKDPNSAGLETVRVSRNPTTVIPANGKVQTNDEATVCVNDLDFFVTVQIFKDSASNLSLGKLCHGYSCEWTSGQKPHLFQKRQEIGCNTENYIPIVVLSLSTILSRWSTSTSSTSVPQDSLRDDSTPSPATA